MNVVDNYVTEVAASMLFGLGYYLVKGIKKKNTKKSLDDKDKSTDTSNIYQSKLNFALEKWGYAKSIEEYNQMIKDHYGKTDPNEILHLIVSQGYTPNIDTYNALLLSCFHGKNFETAKTLQEEILNPVGPVMPNNYTLNILIKGLGVYYRTFYFNKNNSVNEGVDEQSQKNENLGKNINISQNSQNSEKNTQFSQNSEKNTQFSQYSEKNTLNFQNSEKNTLNSQNSEKNTINSQILQKNTINSQNLQKNSINSQNFEKPVYKSQTSEKPMYNSQILLKKEIFEKFDSDLQNLISSFQERNISLDIITHNTILDIYIDQSRLDTALSYYENLKSQKTPFDYYTYTTLLKGIKKSPTTDEQYLLFAFQLLQELNTSLPTPIDESFYNNLLDCCVKFNRIDKAEQLFASMQSEGKAKLKEYSYSIMIKAYSKVYKLNKAIEIFNLLKKVKFEDFMQNFNKQKSNNIENNNFPIEFDDSKSYRSSISHSTFKSKKQKNQICNNSPYPTIITYGAMLNACIRCNNILKAEEIFFEMDKYSIKKNAFIYSTLINGYRKSHNYVKAIQLYENLVKNMSVMLNGGDSNLEDMDKYSVLNSDFNYEEKSVKNDKNGENLLKNENSQNSSSNLVIFNTILDCCIECERYDKMHEIFEFLKNKKNFDKNSKNSQNSEISQISQNSYTQIPDPDIITYSIVIKGYAQSNRIDKVLQIYQFLSDKKNNFTLDEYLYNSILDVFARNGDENTMKKIFYDMREKNISVSVITYGVMIKLYTNLGDVHSADELYEELINKGIKPSVVIYQLLLKLYARKKMPYKAVDIFRNMLIMKIQPDFMIYDYMIKICLRFNYLKEAVEFLISSVKDGFRFEEGVYDEIIDYLIVDREVEESLRIDMSRELINVLKEKGVFISGYIVEKVTKFCQNEKKVSRNFEKNNFIYSKNEKNQKNHKNENYFNKNSCFEYDNRTSYTKNYGNRNKFNENYENYNYKNNYNNNYKNNNNNQFNINYPSNNFEKEFDDTQSYFSQFNLTGTSNKLNMHTVKGGKYNDNEEVEVEMEFDLNPDMDNIDKINHNHNQDDKELILHSESKSNYKNMNMNRNYTSYNKKEFSHNNRQRGNYNNNCQEKSIYDL
jgi:pentatricopeptide repeat protein